MFVHIIIQMINIDIGSAIRQDVLNRLFAGLIDAGQLEVLHLHFFG